MFKRRRPLSIWQNIREVFWPTMGWRRAFRYVRHRVVRLSDSSHKIAGGLAVGTGISFTPLVGTHFIQAGFIAWLCRFNLLAAIIGTFIGNPWTFPFMWWAAISFGSFLFGLFGLPAEAALPEEVNLPMLWDIMWSEPLRIFLPWLVGGYLLMLLSLPVSYYVFFYMVRGAKAARVRARMHKVHKVAREVTGQKY